MVKAVIFDLNGVFIQSPKLSDRFAEDFGVKTEEFLPVLQEILAIVRMPKAEELYTYWQPYFKKWNVNLSKEEFYKYWFEAEKEIPELINFARELRNQGIKVIILSNNFKERAAYYAEHFSFLKDSIDKLYYSWQTGFVKPDVQAFEYVLKDCNLRPQDCIFFDDSTKNIEAATEMNIRSYIYEGLDQAKQLIY